MPRSSGARGIILLAGVCLGIALAVATPASGARTLFYWPTEIDAFAQDGPYVAWLASTPSSVPFACEGATYIRYLPTGRQRSFAARGFVCGAGPGALALGRWRALWAVDPGICGNCSVARVFTASLRGPLVSGLGTYYFIVGGRQLTGLAADWGLRVFSWARYELVSEDCIQLDNVECQWDVMGGGVDQVLGGVRRLIPGVAPPALLAAGAGRIAVAPSADPWAGIEVPQPVENGPVNVLDPGTGVLVMSVSPVGTVRALALSRGALAALVERTDGSTFIERYSIPSGTLVSTQINRHASFGPFDIAGRWIVYGLRRQIHIVDELGGDHLLIVAPAPPIGVSIERRRVAWAENVGGTHRFRAAFVPR